MTINGLYKKIKEVDTDKIVSEVVSENIQVLGEINLSQLYAGKTRAGIDLSPTYLEDPYFSTFEQALAYSNRKDKITPSAERTRFVPNLIINGYYYSRRKVTVSGNKIVYSSEYIEQEILDKYGEEVNGLGGKYKTEFLTLYVKPGVHNRITSVTGLKFKR